MNKIISKIIEHENQKIAKHLIDKDLCLSFEKEFLNNYEEFKGYLLELRDTKLQCVTEKALNAKIDDISKFFSGKEIVLLDILKILIFYRIDEKNSINFLVQRLLHYKALPQYDPNRYDIAFEMFIMRLFSKEFELFNDEVDYFIEEYINPLEIRYASIASLYYNVVKALRFEDKHSIPSKVLNVAIIIESMGIVDGDGLESYYCSFTQDYIKRVAEAMQIVGLNEVGKNLLRGLEFTEDCIELEKLQNKIFKVEKNISIESLLDNYLQLEHHNTGDGSMCSSEN